jgi:hypothetical protein
MEVPGRAAAFCYGFGLGGVFSDADSESMNKEEKGGLWCTWQKLSQSLLLLMSSGQAGDRSGLGLPAWTSGVTFSCNPALLPPSGHRQNCSPQTAVY